MARLLLVEDVAAIANNLADLLRGEGYEVEAATNGNDALCQIDAKDYDLVLLDIGLPGGVSGVDVLRTMDASKVPVIVVTGSVEDLSSFVGVPLRRVITKPLEVKELLAAIAEVLGEAKGVP